MKLTNVLIILAFTAVITSGILFIIFSLSMQQLPKGTKTLPYLFTVADVPGFDLATDQFRLGQLAPGTASSRTFSISDSVAAVKNETKQFTISARGDGVAWLSIDPQFVTAPASVKIQVSVPSNAKKGTYKGEILVIPKN